MSLKHVAFTLFIYILYTNKQIMHLSVGEMREWEWKEDILSDEERAQIKKIFFLCFFFTAVTAIINQIPDGKDLPHQRRRARRECQEEQI